jgi:hypothetical protein
MILFLKHTKGASKAHMALLLQRPPTHGNKLPPPTPAEWQSESQVLAHEGTRLHTDVCLTHSLPRIFAMVTKLTFSLGVIPSASTDEQRQGLYNVWFSKGPDQ